MNIPVDLDFSDFEEDVPTPPPAGFESLVENAFDFFREAFTQISTKPKYSVINFYTGIELLLKARLLHEHWTLVLAKPESGDLRRFLAGDFQSVTLEQAAARLANICDQPLPDELRCFDTIRKHRNKLVHFFHKAYVGTPEEAAIAEVVAEQFRGWIFLHKLLKKKWQPQFQMYSSQIEDLNGLVQRNRQFLATKFQMVAVEIEARRTAGSEFIDCQSCGLAAAEVLRAAPPLIERECLVCGSCVRIIAMNCVDCENQLIEFDDTGEGTCEECEGSFGMDELLAEFGPDGDPKEEPETSYCSNCERTDEQTVVPFGDSYLCLNCAAEFNGFGHCGWCGSSVTDISTDSYLIGCVLCDGSFGNMKGDD